MSYRMDSVFFIAISHSIILVVMSFPCKKVGSYGFKSNKLEQNIKKHGGEKDITIM